MVSWCEATMDDGVIARRVTRRRISSRASRRAPGQPSSGRTTSCAVSPVADVTHRTCSCSGVSCNPTRRVVAPAAAPHRAMLTVTARRSSSGPVTTVTRPRPTPPPTRSSSSNQPVGHRLP
ncbi:hypothetical protein BJF81_13155 [Ornithinimicrobium sp. CNJ-824]|nr:hypothetical protein BJF81_13155 [Ornithinimicrobium sp. CNJ-824]